MSDLGVLLHHIASFAIIGGIDGSCLQIVTCAVSVALCGYAIKKKKLQRSQFVDHCWVPSGKVWPALVPDVCPALAHVVRRDMEGYFLCEPAQTHCKQSQISI